MNGTECGEWLLLFRAHVLQMLEVEQDMRASCAQDSGCKEDERREVSSCSPLSKLDKQYPSLTSGFYTLCCLRRVLRRLTEGRQSPATNQSQSEDSNAPSPLGPEPSRDRLLDGMIPEQDWSALIAHRNGLLPSSHPRPQNHDNFFQALLDGLGRPHIDAVSGLTMI